MKTSEIARIAIWFIFIMIIISFSCDLLSASNTIVNIIGFSVLVTAITLSIKTKCFLKK